MPTRSYDSSDVGHCMGERDEETSDVLGNLGNNSAHAMIRSDPELPRRSEI